MVPKVDAALAALAHQPRALIKIAPASGADAVLRALDAEIGTTFVNAIDGPSASSLMCTATTADSVASRRAEPTRSAES